MKKTYDAPEMDIAWFEPTEDILSASGNNFIPDTEDQDPFSDGIIDT